MLHYFIRDCSQLNSALNLVELNQTADARFMWMNYIANHPTVDATWMCHVTSRNRRPMWNCWSDDFVHFCTLTMMKFIEVDEVGLCYKCGRISTTTAVQLIRIIVMSTCSFIKHWKLLPTLRTVPQSKTAQCPLWNNPRLYLLPNQTQMWLVQRIDNGFL